MSSGHRPINRLPLSSLLALFGLSVVGRGWASQPQGSDREPRRRTAYDVDRIAAAEAKRARRRQRNRQHLQSSIRSNEE